MELGHHISTPYNEELEDIRSKVLQMGGLVEKQSVNAIKALLEYDRELAKKVAKSDDRINDMEVDIDDECIRVIARRQPTAGDLRLIVAVFKVITDLERIGDEAQKIANYAKKLAKKTSIGVMNSELSHLSKLVLRILHDSLDAFARQDVALAVRILKDDTALNKEFDNLLRLLITYMMEDTRNIKSFLRIHWCARSLEHIADHAQNICEYVVYLVEGKDIRHSQVSQNAYKYFPQDAELDNSEQNISEENPVEEISDKE